MAKDADIVVLVSGGQDSTIAYHYAQSQTNNVRALYVDCDQPYRWKELRALENLGIPFTRVRADVCTSALNVCATPERQEIPGRNLLLAYYGSLIGKEVWLSALENELWESHTDKTHEFFYMASALLTSVMKNVRRETKIKTPFEQRTKSDVIDLGLDVLGLTPDYLKQTTSCYDPNLWNCGRCLACFKRWVSWVNNGIEEEFALPPAMSSYAQKVRREMNARDPHYSAKRYAETHSAFLKAGLQGIEGYDGFIPEPGARFRL